MVDTAFDDEEAFPKEQVGGVKRKVVDSTQGMRHLCFLNRTQHTVKPYMWRPAQRRRLNAKRWLANLDMQVKTSTPFVGLVAFQFQENRDPWLDWRRWPWLSIGMDLGADGVAALFGAQYVFSLSVDGVPRSLARGQQRRGQRDYPARLEEPLVARAGFLELAMWAER